MWVVILQTESDISPIYVGKSKRKADKIAKENENVANCEYCYVCKYEGKKES